MPTAGAIGSKTPDSRLHDSKIEPCLWSLAACTGPLGRATTPLASVGCLDQLHNLLAMQRSLKSLCPHWGFDQPGDERRAGRKSFNDFTNVLPFVMPACQQDRITNRERRQALVDDPGERPNLGTHEILLQFGCLMDRRSLGKRNDQYAGEFGIAESGE